MNSNMPLRLEALNGSVKYSMTGALEMVQVIIMKTMHLSRKEKKLSY
jgi:hypothetical protein